MLTTLVENWPGFRDGIMGPELMDEMRVQAERFGAEIIRGNVTGVDLRSRPFTVKTADAEYTARSVIIATGASARLLGIAVGARAHGPRRLHVRDLRRLLLPRQDPSPSSAAATPRWRRRSS